jgi:hypothetical protein
LKSIRPHILPVTSRREFLYRAGGGFGALALTYLLGLNGVSTKGENVRVDPLNPLAPKKPHYPPTAKSVIWLFMEGGPSHLDLFDPKPTLTNSPDSPCRTLLEK